MDQGGHQAAPEFRSRLRFEGRPAAKSVRIWSVVHRTGKDVLEISLGRLNQSNSPRQRAEGFFPG